MTRFILIGNPNTGKTTLLNTLTKSNYHVGNWHGVTVSTKSKNFCVDNKKYTIVDMPGLYSLNSFTPEEKIATDFLFEHSEDVVICLADAHNLSRNLLLTLELMERGLKVVLAINMANELDIDYKKLSSRLGILVFPLDARKKKSAFALIRAIENSTITKSSNIIPKQKPEKFAYIDQILKDITPQSGFYGQSKLDKILYNKFLALPIFLLVMFAVFAITFGGIGQNFSYLVDNIFSYFAGIINSALIKLNISAWAHGLIMGGIVGGVGAVVSFLPQVTLLMLCMNFLEDTGYLSRVAFMFDGALKKVGLTGKSLFSILMGYGCTATAMLSTRTLDKSLQKRTALVLPFASCSAKLPVYALICSAFFVSHKVIVVFGLYLLGIILAILVSSIASKLSKTKDNMIMEIPPLRIQSPAKLIKNCITNALNFAKRIGFTLIMVSVVVWILSNLTFGLKYATNINDSILFVVSKYISVLFRPLGFTSSGIVVALMVGLVAKEMVISTLGVLNGTGASLTVLAASLSLSTSPVWFTPASAMAFLVFILLYSPCLSALSVIRHEISTKFSIFVFVFQFAVAYVGALFTHLIFSLIFAKKIFEAVLVLVLIALIILFVVKYFGKTKNKTCKGKCYGDCLRCGK